MCRNKSAIDSPREKPPRSAVLGTHRGRNMAGQLKKFGSKAPPSHSPCSYSKIRKSGCRFPEKIMLKQEANAKW